MGGEGGCGGRRNTEAGEKRRGERRLSLSGRKILKHAQRAPKRDDKAPRPLNRHHVQQSLTLLSSYASCPSLPNSAPSHQAQFGHCHTVWVYHAWCQVLVAIGKTLCLTAMFRRFVAIRVQKTGIHTLTPMHNANRHPLSTPLPDV